MDRLMTVISNIVKSPVKLLPFVVREAELVFYCDGCEMLCNVEPIQQHGLDFVWKDHPPLKDIAESLVCPFGFKDHNGVDLSGWRVNREND